MIPTTINLWERTKAIIPNGTQTLSKAPERYVNGVYPKFIKSADGCDVIDVEGKHYTDFISGLGGIILGHRYPKVCDLVAQTIYSGTNLPSLLSPLETEVAEMLSQVIPCAKKVKFFKTGSESLSAAVRVARAYTGKEKVAVAGYHGWHDWYTVSTTRAAGIPRALDGLTLKFAYNDIESLRTLFKKHDLAAVVLEPVVYDEPTNDFLKQVVQLAHAHDAVVVFDEVITGFRIGLGGASGYYGVVPDLACFSKAMGNGFPIAALVGLEEYMNTYERPDLFISGTFGGDGVGLAAAKGVMESLPSEIGKIWSSGAKLKRDFNSICADAGISEVSCIGMAPRTAFRFPTLPHKALFWQESVKTGVLFGYNNFITAAHTEAVVNKALEACWNALHVVKDAWSDPMSKLEGELPQEVFPAR